MQQTSRPPVSREAVVKQPSIASIPTQYVTESQIAINISVTRINRCGCVVFGASTPGVCKMAESQSYSDKLKDPRWQKVRLHVLERDKWKCQQCGTTTDELHVHHGMYRFGMDPWEYPLEYLRSYCRPCHDIANEQRIFAQCALAALNLNSQMAVFEIVRLVLPLDDKQRFAVLDELTRDVKKLLPQE